jgi:hypothetical protein
MKKYEEPRTAPRHPQAREAAARPVVLEVDDHGQAGTGLWAAQHDRVLGTEDVRGLWQPGHHVHLQHILGRARAVEHNGTLMPEMPMFHCVRLGRLLSSLEAFAYRASITCLRGSTRRR